MVTGLTGLPLMLWVASLEDSSRHEGGEGRADSRERRTATKKRNRLRLRPGCKKGGGVVRPVSPWKEDCFGPVSVSLGEMEKRPAPNQPDETPRPGPRKKKSARADRCQTLSQCAREKYPFIKRSRVVSWEKGDSPHQELQKIVDFPPRAEQKASPPPEGRRWRPWRKGPGPG